MPKTTIWKIEIITADEVDKDELLYQIKELYEDKTCRSPFDVKLSSTEVHGNGTLH